MSKREEILHKLTTEERNTIPTEREDIAAERENIDN